MRNFYPLPSSPYNGTFSARPFNGSGVGNLIVNALVKWATYSVAGQSLGNVNDEFSVTMDLNASASNIVSMTWVIRSVYIDNSAVNFPVFIYFPSTGFAISCPPNASGWYQVFTFDRRAWICGIGISDIDIQNQAVTNVFFTDGIVNSYLDQDEPTAVEMKLASPLISYGGGGGGVSQIRIISTGQWAVTSGLSIVGGGGNGAAAVVNVNSNGNAISVSLISGGSLYSGPPIVTYAGSYVPPPAFNPGQAYAQNGYRVSYNGYVYALATTGKIVIGIYPSGGPSSTDIWNYTGLTSAFIAPTFQASVAPIFSGVSFSNVGTFGPAALGDQISDFNDVVAAPSILHNNVFNTPYSDGYIYITNVDARLAQSSGVCSWVLEDTDGNAIINFYASAVQQIKNLQGCNLKLPADQTYRLRCAAVTSPSNINTVFVWTYSQTPR